MMKIGAISLGCDKNRVDTEKTLSRLSQGGHTIVSNADEADILLVNTCAFIDKAKEESIDEILWAIDWKKGGKARKVIVSGCLSQRYADTLKEEFPEVDAIIGVGSYDKILQVISDAEKGEKTLSTSCSDKFFAGRVLTTPYHYAYLKIADGCNNHCTYCAIPSIRGKYRSERQEDLIEEAKRLADDGVKELILVAQDVTRYGVDWDGKSHLTELVSALEILDFDWIRLLYLEPEMVDDALIDFVANEPKVVKYMDIPFQHIDSDLLKRMNRHTDENYIRALVGKVRGKGIKVRSSFICGFPGESEQAYQKLYDFIKDGNIDYAGFFAYSREEGTPADKMEGHLPEEVKSARADSLTKLQNEIMSNEAKKLIGKRMRVLYEDIDFDRQMFLGRHSAQTPDIDNVVYFTADNEVSVGDFYDVEIVGVDGVDLIGRVVE